MNPFILYPTSILLAYLIGAIPFSFIVAKMWGIDLRTIGSGNIGATNVLRAAGKLPGVLAYVLDIGKGMVVVVSLYFIMKNIAGDSFPRYMLYASSLAAILGHIYPVYLGFKGGKGVATSAGVMFVLVPIPLLISLVSFFVSFFISKKIVSVGSTAAALTLPIALSVVYKVESFQKAYECFFNVKDAPIADFISILSFALIITAFVVIKHIPNYKRLLKGEELGFGAKK